MNKLEELDKLVPEEDEIKEKKAPKKAPETKKVKTEEPKEEPTKTEKKAGGYPTLTNLKKELRAYIADNYEDKELPEELTVAELRNGTTLHRKVANCLLRITKSRKTKKKEQKRRNRKIRQLKKGKHQQAFLTLLHHG